MLVTEGRLAILYTTQLVMIEIPLHIFRLLVIAIALLEGIVLLEGIALIEGTALLEGIALLTGRRAILYTIQLATPTAETLKLQKLLLNNYSFTSEGFFVIN